MGTPLAIAGVDQTFLETGLPHAPVFLGSGVDPQDGHPITGFQWVLLDSPLASAAVLVGDATATPTLNNVDVWGNYRLFLVVTDSNADVSEPNPLIAPSSAFTVVRVTSEHAVLQKPAKAERDTRDIQHEVIQVVEDLRDEVTVLQGAPAPPIPVATPLVRGTVRLLDTPVAPGDPVIVNDSRVYFTGTANGSTMPGGYSPGTIEVQTSLAGSSEAHMAWHIHEAGIYIDAFTVTFLDGGTDPGAGYDVFLYSMSPADFAANTFNLPDVVARMTFPTPAVGGPVAQSAAAPGQPSLPVGNVLAVRVQAAPGVAPGGGMTVVAAARKKG